MSDMSEAPSLASRPATRHPNGNLDLLSGITLRVSVEVGSASLSLSELLRLSEGSIVELDRQTNDHLDIFANGTLIAKGEIVEVDGHYGIRVVDVVAPDRSLTGMEA